MESPENPVRFIVSIVFGLAIGLIGDAPRWALFGVYFPLSLLIPKFLWHKRRMERYWRGFELVLESERILVLEHEAVTRTLTKPDIGRVVEVGPYGLKILGTDARKHLWVPSALNDYDELRAYLSGWAPFETPTRPGPASRPRSRLIAGFLQRHIGMVGCISLYASALLVRSPYLLYPLVAIVGVILLQQAYVLAANQRIPTRATLIPLALLALLAAKAAFTVG